ncbi:hypothetical protein [Streptomyces caelestis]|uniref:hypothetical protein n=1 Tax=Streptomyces caelestis TaxID=36816 RepID=UPI00365B47E6
MPAPTNTGALIHEVAAANLPVDPSVDAELLAQADHAFKHLGPAGFTIDDSSPKLAEAFTAVYSGNGIPAATVGPASEMAIGVAILAWGLLDWQPLDDVDPTNEAWQLGVTSTREIQRLSVFGPTGQAAAEQTTPDGLLEMFRQMTQLSKPLDFAAFNAYHHGGKVNRQDLDFLDDARRRADAEGLDVPALRELISRLHSA